MYRDGIHEYPVAHLNRRSPACSLSLSHSFFGYRCLREATPLLLSSCAIGNYRHREIERRDWSRRAILKNAICLLSYPPLYPTVSWGLFVFRHSIYLEAPRLASFPSRLSFNLFSVISRNLNDDASPLPCCSRAMALSNAYI